MENTHDRIAASPVYGNRLPKGNLRNNLKHHYASRVSWNHSKYQRRDSFKQPNKTYEKRWFLSTTFFV